MQFPRFKNTETGRNADLSLKDAFRFSTAAFFLRTPKSFATGKYNLFAVFVFLYDLSSTEFSSSKLLYTRWSFWLITYNCLLIELHVLPVSKEAAVLQNKLKFPYIEMPRQLSSKNKARFTGSADAQVNTMKLEKPFVQSKS